MNGDTSRLEKCGWSSFGVQLFLNEPGRKARAIGDSFVNLLSTHCNGKHVLELCCGAGALSLQLARAGYQVTGLDLSNQMLAVFEEQLRLEDEEVRARVRLVQADMCTFQLQARFDFIILEDDGFVYLLDHRDQLACLSRIHEHLADTGRGFLSFTTPQRELASSGDFSYDPIRQVKTVRCQWQSRTASGDTILIKSGIERRRLVYPAELELLLRCAGFDVLSRWGDLAQAQFVDPMTQEYNYLICKPRGAQAAPGCNM